MPTKFFLLSVNQETGRRERSYFWGGLWISLHNRKGLSLDYPRHNRKGLGHSGNENG